MASRNTRRLDVEIGSEAKGDGFKKTESDLDKLQAKLKETGDKGGKGLETGLDGSASRVQRKLRDIGDKAGEQLKTGVKAGSAGLESVGSSAADAFSGGFDLDGLVDIASNAFSGMSGKLGPIAGGVGVAAAGAVAAGFMSGMQSEVSADRLAAQVGGGDWGRQAGEIAGDLYLQGFGESMDDIANTTAAVLQSTLVPFGANQDALEDIVGTAATFADVMGQDVNASVAAVDRMIASGLVPNAEAGFDILTTGLQEMGPAGEDLLDTFTEYPQLFQALGFNGQQALGAINTLLDAGVRNTDLAADALKEFQIRAQDGSATTVDAFEAMGLNAEAMMGKIAAGGPGALEGLNQVLAGLQGIEDPVKRNAIGVQLFGTQWEDTAGTLANADFSNAVAGLGEIEGRTDALSDAYDNGASRFETFKRQALDKLATVVNEDVMPALESLQAWAEENPGKFQVVAAVIGGVLVLAFLAWAASAASAAVATLAATWPLLLIGAVIAGLAALVIIHFDTIKRWISNVFNWVKENWPLLAAILTGPFGIAVLLITRNWDTIKAGATAVKDWIVSAFNTVKEKVGGVFSWIKDKATGAKDWIVDKFTDVVDFFKGLPGAITDAFSGVGDSIVSGIKSVWNNTVGGFGFTVPSWVPGVGGKGFHIPELHSGGIFNSGQGEGLAFLEDGEGVFTADQMAAMGGDGGNIYVTVNAKVIRSDSEFEDLVIDALRTGGAKGKPVTIGGRRL